MNIDHFFALITLYPIIKDIYKDIRLIFEEKDKLEKRYILWNKNRKKIFLCLILFIFFLMLFITSLAVSIGSMLTHNTLPFIIFTLATALFLYYTVILLVSLITKIAIILISKK